MGSLTFYVLLLVAIIAGWILGKLGSSNSTRSKTSSTDLFEDYFVGLNYLLNDEPDEAIDTFIKALEINSETAETHLALGALLRRRGKVDKAIKVHQTLLARPNLDRDFANSVRLQLALNYIAAGLLDRAERLLKEIMEDGGDARADALQQLITIYQTEKEWENAISSTVELLKSARFKKNPALLSAAAHYCCELAEKHLQENRESQARLEVKRAFTFERKNMRAMLLLASIEQQQGNYKAAVKELLRIRAASPVFIPQILEPLALCHEKLGLHAEYEQLLKKMIREDSSAEAMIALAALVSAKSGNAEAIALLKEHLEGKASQKALVELLGLQLHGIDEDVATSLESLLTLVKEQAESKAEYRCYHCGFETKSLFWMCPSCKKWDKIQPIREP